MPDGEKDADASCPRTKGLLAWRRGEAAAAVSVMEKADNSAVFWAQLKE